MNMKYRSNILSNRPALANVVDSVRTVDPPYAPTFELPNVISKQLIYLVEMRVFIFHLNSFIALNLQKEERFLFDPNQA